MLPETMAPRNFLVPEECDRRALKYQCHKHCQRIKSGKSSHCVACSHTPLVLENSNVKQNNCRNDQKKAHAGEYLMNKDGLIVVSITIIVTWVKEY